MLPPLRLATPRGDGEQKTSGLTLPLLSSPSNSNTSLQPATTLTAISARQDHDTVYATGLTAMLMRG
jgi:hypothetical protein